jgi:hypothetical protein
VLTAGPGAERMHHPLPCEALTRSDHVEAPVVDTTLQRHRSGAADQGHVLMVAVIRSRRIRSGRSRSSLLGKRSAPRW